MWNSSSTSITYPTTTGTDQQDDIVKKYESMIKKMSKAVLKAVKEKDYKGAEECARAILFLEEAIRVRNNPVQWSSNPLIPGEPAPTIFYNQDLKEYGDNKITWTDSDGNTKEYTIENWYETFYPNEE